MTHKIDREIEGDLMRLEEATREEIANLRKDAEDLERELAAMVRERVLRHGRAA